MQDEKIGRNDSCPCGSGEKYKKCCLLTVLQHSDTIDPAWRKLRQTEGELIDNHLLSYVTREFPKELGEIAWSDFLFGEEWPEEMYDRLQENLFIPWFLFDWIPIIDALDDKTEFHKKPIALNCLQRFYNRFNDTQRRFIETICRSHYSFYVVLDIVPRQSIKLKDILLQTEHVVREYQGTEYLHRGDIIFTRILTLDGVSISIGTAPHIIPSQCHIELLDFRKELEKEYGKPLTPELLREEGDDLRLYYFDLMDEIFNKPMPVLHNTDGDLFECCIVHFKLSISPNDALYKLLPLTLSDNPKEFLEKAKKDKNGQLKQIKFPWLKLGNNKHQQWDNTLMGNITIIPGKITVEVNSKARAEAILNLINNYLGDDVSYQKTKVESVEKKLLTAKSSKEKKSEKIDINDSPEAQAFFKEYTEKHWNNWLNESIPILGGLTPYQAAKTTDGREKLEALLLDFDRRNERSQHNLLSPNVNELRKKLGLI
jgi:hypothetical protein